MFQPPKLTFVMLALAATCSLPGHASAGDDGISDQTRCETTRGVWDALSCGHYSCGYQPECAAVIPGCDCGPGRNFVEGVGCVDDPTCPNFCHRPNAAPLF